MGEIRSNTTNDIALLVLDTNHNEECLFARHAYFAGAGDPYDTLQRGLKADTDETARSALYSTISRPFPKPETGIIAVKVINH